MRVYAPSGLASFPNIRWGSHLCQGFESARDLEDCLIPYFKAGLENNEACLWITAAPFPATDARDALRRVVPDLDAREAARQIEIRNASDWYNGQPGILNDLLRREREALELGFAGLRASGNCSWVSDDHRDAFQRHEELVQSAVKGRRVICLCSYGLHQVRAPAFHEVVFAHDMTLGPGRRTNHARVELSFEQEAAPSGTPVTLDDVILTSRLEQRPSVASHRLELKPALDDLLRHVSGQPSALLLKLVELTHKICDADSAGVSVLKDEEFHWLGLTGTLAAFEGATAPRDNSPCGVCLDRGDVVLMEAPERIYSWIAEANISIPEVLLAPLRGPDGEHVGTLWAVAKQKGVFGPEHALTLFELATLTGVALHSMRIEERLTRALEEERLVSGEMSHRVKNVYAVAAGIVKMSADKTSSVQEMADTVVARLTALGRAQGIALASPDAICLRDLLRTLLEPYSNVSIDGPSVYIGERALTPVAMTFHELATNAVKYGALGVPDGRIEISWTVDETNLSLTWREVSSRSPDAPAPLGFGSALIRSSIASLGGTIFKSWPETGLVAVIGLPLAELSADV